MGSRFVFERVLICHTELQQKHTVVSAHKKSRLQRRNWLDQALVEIIETGIEGISIDRLASNLGVTRGGFYHHFVDRTEFIDALLEYLERRWTIKLGEEIRALGLDPVQSLLALSRMIRHRRAAEYDCVFRFWAMHNKKAQDTLERVDEYRLAVIRELFQGAGFAGIDAENRARIYLYYESAEPPILAHQDSAIQEQLVVQRLNLLTDGGLGS